MHPLRHPRMLLSGDLPNSLTTAKQPPINLSSPHAPPLSSPHALKRGPPKPPDYRKTTSKQPFTPSQQTLHLNHQATFTPATKTLSSLHAPPPSSPHALKRGTPKPPDYRKTTSNQPVIPACTSSVIPARKQPRHPRTLLSGELPNPLTNSNQPTINLPSQANKPFILANKNRLYRR